MNTLRDAARLALDHADPKRKIETVYEMATKWQAGDLVDLGLAFAQVYPGRNQKLELRSASNMPKRGRGMSRANRAALLHALAHIELNAVNLACDLIARYEEPVMPNDYYDDWVQIAKEEARHFSLLSDRLKTIGMSYGSLPAHDGLWEAATRTSHNLLARLAVVPLVLEARGIDVTPRMIANMKKAHDIQTAATLTLIYKDEIRHVAIGKKWFNYICETKSVDPEETWQCLVKQHFNGKLKPPFNHEGREAAGFLNREYENLT